MFLIIVSQCRKPKKEKMNKVETYIEYYTRYDGVQIEPQKNTAGTFHVDHGIRFLFQGKDKIFRFSTSRQTLTWIPDSFFTR